MDAGQFKVVSVLGKVVVLDRMVDEVLPFPARHNGTLRTVEYSENYGNRVVVDYEDGTQVAYGGLALRDIQIPAPIVEGAPIGYAVGCVTVETRFGR